MVAIACAFKVGSSSCRRNFLLGIAYPVVGPLFRYKGCSGRRRSDEAVIMKKAEVWL